MLLTPGDVLFKVRSSDNHVKVLGNLKADKEGHSTDAFADSLSREIIALWFGC